MPEPAVIYVPIGMGSGICGVVAARNARGKKTKVVGVVSSGAPAYSLSPRRGVLQSHPVSTRIADGMACRTPDPFALDWIPRGMERVVEVSDDEIEEAMRLYFTATQNVAEGAGATALAATLQEQSLIRGKRISLVLSGGNVDGRIFSRVLGNDSQKLGDAHELPTAVGNSGRACWPGHRSSLRGSCCRDCSVRYVSSLQHPAIALHFVLIHTSVYCKTACISTSPPTPAWSMWNTR
jgi:threonine dehydratase